MILTDILAESRVIELDTRLSAVHVNNGVVGLTTLVALVHLPCSLDDETSGSLRLLAERVFRERLRVRMTEDQYWSQSGDVRLSHTYSAVRCEIEIPDYWAADAYSALVEIIRAPIAASEALTCWNLLNDGETGPVDHLRFALQGALFPDRSRFAAPPGVLGPIHPQAAARAISKAGLSLVSVGGWVPDLPSGVQNSMLTPDSMSRASSTPWALPDPAGHLVQVRRMATDALVDGRLLVAFRFPGPTHVDWPLSLLVHALFGSGTAGRVNHALRGGDAVSYGANVQLALLDGEAVLVTEARFDAQQFSNVLSCLRDAFFSGELASDYWVDFAREATLSYLEMLAYSSGRLADVLASVIEHTGFIDGLKSLPTLVSVVTVERLTQFCSHYLTESRAHIGVEGGFPEDVNVQQLVMEQFFDTFRPTHSYCDGPAWQS